MYPTRALFNKHAANTDARLFRRCGREPETAFHILQVWDSARPAHRVPQLGSPAGGSADRAKEPLTKVKTEVTFTVKGQTFRPNVVVET